MNSNLKQMQTKAELSANKAQQQCKKSLLAKSKLNLCGITILAAALLAACSSGTVGSAPDSNANLSNALTLEKTATVPVIDGKATQTGVYIHNNTGQVISGIQYSSVATSMASGLQEASANSKLQLMQNSCTTIAANSSCLLGFSTPSLSLGQSGSTLIDASYNGQHSKQLINYRYYTSNDYTGVNFSDGSSSLYGTNDYATVYAFVGKGQSQTKVGFNASNPSLAVNSGLTNGSVDIASNQVVALEIKSNQAVTSNLVSLTPYTVTSSQQLANSLQSANLQNQNLQVTISPTQQANLLMGDSPVLSATGESTATITIINNGNQIATNVILSSADSTKISITPASSNPCSSGGSLEAGASCNYKLSLVDLYNNGSSSLDLAYNNNVTSISASQTVYYYNNLAAPMVSVVPTSSSFSESINTANTQIFNVQNIGNAPLNNLGVSFSKTLTQATLSQTNDCGTSIPAKGGCTITATITANANIDSGIFYAKLNGDFYNGVTTRGYSFVSKPVSTTITDPTIATITSTTPQDATTDVSVATSIALSFSKAMDPTTLNSTNIQLQKVSDSSSVLLTFQGVTNNNQTVTFTQTSGNLSALTGYKIVINPSAIKDYNGNSMGAASSQQTASFTTTGGNVAPTISSVNPSTGASNQSTTPTIDISFSEPMNPATLTPDNITLKTAAGVTVSGTSIVISNNNQTATVNLNGNPLADTTGYQLVLNQNNLTDVDGNQLGIDAAYVATSFTTGDFNAPTLSSSIPLNGATNVALESAISLSFSEAMDTASLSTTTVQLQKVSDNSNISLNTPSFSNNNQTVTFQPSSSLTAGESYNIVIYPSLIKDVAGNTISGVASQIVSKFSVLPAITITPLADWQTIIGSAYAITASIKGGSSTLTPTVTGFATGVALSPANCTLNSADAATTSCTFIVTPYTGYSLWSPSTTANSTDVNMPASYNSTPNIALSVIATNGAIINGSATQPFTVSGISATSIIPYTYLPAAESGAASATKTGITWGTGGALVTRFTGGTTKGGATCGDSRKDNLTGLEWAKNGIIGFKNQDGSLDTSPNYANTTASLNNLKWESAVTAIANLNAASTKLCGQSDWRLPTINELNSLVYYKAASPAAWLKLSPQGFSSVQAVGYWSSSPGASDASTAWVVSFNSGYVAALGKHYNSSVWPVRGGQ